MDMEEKTPFYKQIWFLGGLGTIAIFVLCFVALDLVGSPDGPEKPDVEMEVIATVQTNEPLIAIAREQGWIAADATEMTSVDAVNVDSIGMAFAGSNLQTFNEFKYFLCVTEIDSGAFSNSNQLREITIPAQVSSIDYGALADCPALETISVDTANTHYDSRDNCNGIVCTWKGKLMLLAGCKNTKLSDRMKYIAPHAFRGCTELTSIAFPERMDEIGEQAFRGCKSLKEVEIPQGVRFVEAGTFMDCESLQKVTIPKSVERLLDNAFYHCKKLSVIETPKRFPPIIINAFDNYSATVYVPKGQSNKYSTDRYWKVFQNFKELP